MLQFRSVVGLEIGGPPLWEAFKIGSLRAFKFWSLGSVKFRGFSYLGTQGLGVCGGPLECEGLGGTF